MNAPQQSKLSSAKNWTVGVIILAGIAVGLTFALSGAKNQNTRSLAGSPLLAAALAADAPATAPSATPPNAGSAMAMQQAASANKYLFAFVYDKDDEATRTIHKTFDDAVRKITPAPQTVAVDRNGLSEKEFVTKYGLDRAPMPLVVAMAPNGAFTGGMRATEVTESRLRDAIASPGLQQCLKALQDRRLVLVCLQNGQTQANDAAMKGVNDFKADPQFGNATEIVKVDPSDPNETKLLAQLQADPKAKTATTAFLAPPGVLVAKMEGSTTKDGLMASLQKAMASCAPGSGCCPAPK